MNEIELFDGTILQFPADTSQEVIDRTVRLETAARQQPSGQQAAQPAVAQPVATGPQVIYTTPDGGRIYQMPDGSRAFASAGYATTDPAEIDRLIEGATPEQLVRTSISEQILRERPVASRVATAAQGVPFIGTYTDELGGPEAGERARRAVEAVREERPGQALGLEIAGTVAALPLIAAVTPAAVPAYVTGATSLAGKALRAGAVATPAGVIEGGISGFGRGEGDGRTEEAITGAQFGLLAGPISAAMPVAGAGVEQVVLAFQRLKGRGIPEIGRRLGISNDAAKVVKTALQNDDFAAAQAALQRAGSTSMLADAGPATQQLLDTSITAGGTAPRIAREAVDARTVESGARMTQVLDGVLGTPEGTNALRRSIREETARPREASYRNAYSKFIDYNGRRGRHLENLMGRVPQSAIDEANKLMRIEGVKSQEILVDIADNGLVTFSRLPDVRQLDYITRALGGVAKVENAKGGVLGGTTPLGNAIANLSRDIRRTLRNEVPEYGVALDTAADAINRSDAVELGASIFNPSTTREVLRDGLKGASKAEQEAARAGFRSAFDERLANVQAAASNPNTDIREFQKMANELRSRAMRENMEVLLGKPAADNLYKQLDEQVVVLELRAAVTRNSSTARRQATMGQVDDLTRPTILETLFSGEPINATKKLISAITGNSEEARALRKMGIYDEVAKVLVTQRGPEAQRALRLVERAMAGDALNQVQASIIARAITRPAAMAAYGAMRPEPEAAPMLAPQTDVPTLPIIQPAPTAPPQARVQPTASPATRGLPFMTNQQAAVPMPPQPAPASPQARQMLAAAFPNDAILQAATRPV
jgi:hypothetical protein